MQESELRHRKLYRNLRLPVICVLLMQVGGVGWKLGAYASSAVRQDSRDVIKLEATLVQLPVTVRDKGGRYVVDLQAGDFEIIEDGVRQDIELFRPVDEPFSVVLALDCSGSTKDQLDSIKAAGRAFIRTLRPRDKAMIVSFSDSVTVHCGLTGDLRVLEGAIQAIEPGEYTQVYEAVYTAVWERLAYVEGRKAVVLFTDGIDTASSEIGEEDTLDAVIESEDIIVYPIRYNTRSDVEQQIAGINSVGVEPEKRSGLDRAYRAADEYLFKLAEYSGGVIERADEISDLTAALSRIAEELRRQYLIGYYPKESLKKGQKSIKVNVRREGAKVRVRPAYTR